MPNSSFLSGAFVADLAGGAEYAVTAFRACARCAPGCRSVRKVFETKVSADADALRRDFTTFAQLLGRVGRRAVTLAPPGTARITADELSFVAAMAAAQSGEVGRLSAHLHWLFAGSYPFEAEDAVYRAAAGLYLNGLMVDAPVMEEPVTLAAMTARPVNYSGHA